MYSYSDEISQVRNTLMIGAVDDIQLIGDSVLAIATILSQPAVNLPKYKGGFEFILHGEEAMIWSAKQRTSTHGSSFVYLVMVDWERLTVMTEEELDDVLSDL